MKIVFVEHPCPVLLCGNEPWSPIRTNTWPQSQVTLAAAVPSEHEVSIMDLRSLPEGTQWRQAIGFEYLPPIRYGDWSLTRHLIGNYAQKISQSPADIFVLTANFTSEANAVAEVMHTIKRLWPKALLLVGGSDASPKERHGFYFNAGADYIGTGDGDRALPNFLAMLTTGHKPATKYIHAPLGQDFRLAHPGVESLGLPSERYRESGGGTIVPGVFEGGGFAAYVETSRGCSRECEFCTARKTSLWAPPVDSVLGYMDNLIAYGCKMFMFSDDNLLLARRPEELLEIFTHLRQKGVAWEFQNGLEVGLLADNQGQFKQQLFEALFWNKRGENQFAGAHRLLVPIEDAFSHNSTLSKLKRIQLHVGELLQRLLDTDIPFLNLALMIGGVQETAADRERLERNLELIYSLKKRWSTTVNFSLFCTSPLPGTPLGRELTNRNRLSHSIEDAPELWTVFASVINGDTFTAEQTTNYRRELLQRFHMSQDEGRVKPQA